LVFDPAAVHKTIAVISTEPRLAAAYGVFFCVHGVNFFLKKSKVKVCDFVIAYRSKA
jgi:hypothetical protein